MSGDSSGRRPEGRGRAREPHRGRPRSRSRSRSPLGPRRGAAPARREAPERPSPEDGEPSDSGDELLDPASLEAETDHGLCRQIRHQYRALITSVQRKRAARGGGAGPGPGRGVQEGGSARGPASPVPLGPQDLAGAGPGGRHRGARSRETCHRAGPCARVARAPGPPSWRTIPPARLRAPGLWAAGGWREPLPGAGRALSKAPFWLKRGRRGGAEARGGGAGCARLALWGWEWRGEGVAGPLPSLCFETENREDILNASDRLTEVLEEANTLFTGGGFSFTSF